MLFRAIVEPARLLTAQELRQRVCDYFGCEQTELLVQQVSSEVERNMHRRCKKTSSSVPTSFRSREPMG